MIIFLILFTVTLAGARSVFSKLGNKYITKKQQLMSFNFFVFLTGAIVIFIKCVIDNDFKASGYTCFIAFFYAMFTLLCQLLYMKAIDNGDVGLTTLIYSSGFIFPTIFGTIAYNEQITIFKIIGILVILASFAVSTVSKNQKVNRKWFLYTFSSMFSVGAVGISQKIFRMSEYSHQQNGFLLAAFLVIIVTTFIMMPKERQIFSKGIGITSASVGVCFGIINIINTYLSGVVPSMIMFPTVNGGGIVMSGIFAYLFLREKLTVQKAIGIAVGIFGIILVAL